jgi:hypothetical protein
VWTDRFCDIASLLGVKHPRREALASSAASYEYRQSYLNSPIRLHFVFLNSAPKIRQILTLWYPKLAECINQNGWACSTHFRDETINTKFYESEKIKKRDNFGDIELDGTFLVSPLRYNVPVQMVTDVSKDHAAPIFTPTAPKTGQRWRRQLLQC